MGSQVLFGRIGRSANKRLFNNKLIDRGNIHLCSPPPPHTFLMRLDPISSDFLFSVLHAQIHIRNTWRVSELKR